MDLNAPLGMTPPPRSRRRLVVYGAAASVTILALTGVGFVLATADPRGGEPYAVGVLPPLVSPPAPRSASLDPTPTGTVPQAAARTISGSTVTRTSDVPVNAGTLENGVRVFRGTEPGSAASHGPGGPLMINVPSVLDDAPGKKRVGAGASGGSGGPSLAGQTSAATPRVAIFVAGMGLSPTATRTATELMPAAVTFAFLPYANKASVEAAKAKGHEILLQLPMENAQGGTPGPHTLRPNEPADALSNDLDWLMSRFGGYDGVTNLLGGPVTENAATMRAVLKIVSGRNLFFVDDGTSKHSLAPSLASELNVAETGADVVLDATADPAVVRANLDRLVAIARSKGHAIGMASGLPEHLGAIARFAADMSTQNIALVPVGTLTQRGSNLAAVTK